jgi:hypothetical protein
VTDGDDPDRPHQQDEECQKEDGDQTDPPRHPRPQAAPFGVAHVPRAPDLARENEDHRNRDG